MILSPFPRLPFSCFLAIVAIFSLFAVALPVAASADDNAASVVNIYSYRQAYLLKPLLDAFTSETNIKTNVIYAKTGLISRMKTEGATSPADVLVLPSYDLLFEAINADIIAPIPSGLIPEKLPSWLADNDNKRWLALSIRSRIIFASKNRVPAGTIDSYLSLAEPRFKGKICIRSGLHPYNLSLFAEIYDKIGSQKTVAFLKDLKNNLARRPQGNDREQLRAVSSGICDVAIANSYYYSILANGNDDQKAIANAIYPISPTGEPIETHVNISGIAMARYAKNQQQAQALIAFMTGDTAQKMYVEQNKEWPVTGLIVPLLQSSAMLPDLAYKKTRPPQWNAIMAGKKEIIRILNDIGFNE